jgi:hypothetical protein
MNSKSHIGASGALNQQVGGEGGEGQTPLAAFAAFASVARGPLRG